MEKRKPVKKKKRELKAIDFFCGAGGVTYGLRKAGIKVLGGIDFDKNCKSTYEFNNPGAKFIHADITSLTERRLSSLFKIKKNDDNLVLIGCSPCQYWSIIKTDKTKSEKSKNLLLDFQRFVEYFLPGIVVIENVPGILKKKNESPLPDFINFLTTNNYEVDYKVINANEYGVPQTRKRFVLLASRLKKGIKIPKSTQKYPPLVKNFIGEQNGFKKIAAGHKDTTDFLHSVCNLSDLNIERLKATPKNGGTRLAWKKNKRLQLQAYIGKDHAFRDVYGRMFWNKPAPTITTKFYSISNGRFAHPTENRAISLREGATLQTFPKSYKFKASSVEAIAKLIGNAVPPELSKRLGKAILKATD